MTAAGRPQRDGLSIGSVLAQLRKDFPDITISKIRFLESEGLVQPARAPSGYRQFAPADVERLRFVLTAQRDHYLPLKAIKEQLDAADEGLESRGTEAQMPRGLVPLGSFETGGEPSATSVPADFSGSDRVRLTREELLTKAAIDDPMLRELQQYGLVRPDTAELYDADDVQIARTVQQMSSFGLEPRHLRAFRTSVDREVGLVEQIAAPMYRHPDADAKARAGELVRELAALSVTLHTLLVKAGIRELTGG